MYAKIMRQTRIGRECHICVPLINTTGLVHSLISLPFTDVKSITSLTSAPLAILYVVVLASNVYVLFKSIASLILIKHLSKQSINVSSF